MTNSQVQDLVYYVFEKILEAESIQSLEKIFDDPNAAPIKKCRLDEKSYPKLHFKITAEELNNLECINKDYTLNSVISGLDLNPLTKLLYAVCWKNGDLKKVKHIVQGILSDQNNTDKKEDGLVFYQFGKYLTKKPGEPIIDQHIIRAFSIYKIINPDDNDLNRIRRKSIIDKKDQNCIVEYKNWLSTDLKEQLRKSEDYCYYIDQLLFALGKAIKIRSKTRTRKEIPTLTSSK